MTLFTRGVPMLFGRRPVPIQLVNKPPAASRGASGSPIVFQDLPYGAYPTERRLCIVGATSQDGGNVSNLTHDTLTWGGLVFNRRAHTALLVSGESITVSIWSKFVPAGRLGDLVITHNKSICDSMGIATLVTTLCDSEAPVDADSGSGISGTQYRIDDLATANDGFVLGLGNLAFVSGSWQSMVGNGGVGTVPQLLDVAVAGEHKMGLWLKTGTPAGATEDFTMTHFAPASPDVGVAASWAGGT